MQSEAEVKADIAMKAADRPRHPRRVAGTQHGRAQILSPSRSKVRNASSGR